MRRAVRRSRRDSGPLSDELERWLTADSARTLGSLVEAFREKSFAVLFVVLLGVPALPIPTGGATHVLEAIAMLLAVELLVGRDEVWLPRRWRDLRLAGDKRRRLIERLIRMIRWLERHSRPRGSRLFGHRLSNAAFGALVLGGSLAAFVAPPFSWLDTLPALGVVLLSLGVLLEDVVVVAVALLVGAAGIALIAVLGRAALRGLGELAWIGALHLELEPPAGEAAQQMGLARLGCVEHAGHPDRLRQQSRTYGEDRLRGRAGPSG